MGAEQFTHSARGKTAKEAFENARKEALHDYGHSGYSGTIAEKNSFIEIPLPLGYEVGEYIDKLFETNDRRIDDKWGPAGCIKVKDGLYSFFGWASS